MLSEDPNNNVFVRVDIIFGHFNYIIIKYEKRSTRREFGYNFLDNQEKIKKAKIAVIGVGGLGSAASIYMAIAGIGYLLLVDEDRPSLSNLNRQILYGESDLHEKRKPLVAKRKLQELNSQIEIETHSNKIQKDNIEALLQGVDIVMDALDNFETRYLLNEFCVRRKNHSYMLRLKDSTVNSLPSYPVERPV